MTVPRDASTIGKGFRPTLVAEVELAEPVSELVPYRGEGEVPYGSALTIVRLHALPLGLVWTELHDCGLSADAHADAIWEGLGDDINRHLRRDGLDPVSALATAGLRSESEPDCTAARRAFLASAPPITVVVPTRERPDRLQVCIERILASDYPCGRLQVIVADNAPSSDRTRTLVAAYPERVRYVREDMPGSASARNRALQLADTELVLFTDDDVGVDVNWAVETTRAFSSTEGVDCVTGLVLPGELETPAQVWFEEYGGFSRGFERRVYDLGQNQPMDAPLYPFAAGIFGTGNNMAFRRSSLRAIGDFDPALGNGTPALGGVDSEVLLRTVLSGQRIVYDPRSVVFHLHRPDYRHLRRQVYNYGAGLTAYLLKTLMANPRLFLAFSRKVPRGLAFALRPGSAKNVGKSPTYPRELTRVELRGMLYGPLGYARSRRMYGRHRVLRSDEKETGR
jgi:O-antigen biosynthesis protein